jgi:hypothetical protein
MNMSSLLLKHKNLGLAAGLLVTLGTFSQSSFALSCKQNGSVSQIITLDKPIKVSTANTAAGALLWRSQTFTSTFQCVDDRDYPKGENAYLYWIRRRICAISTNLSRLVSTTTAWIIS